MDIRFSGSLRYFRIYGNHGISSTPQTAWDDGRAKQRYGKNSLGLCQQLAKRAHGSNTGGICLCANNQRGYLKNGNPFSDSLSVLLDIVD